MRPPILRVILALLLAAVPGIGASGPVIACPDGPDPLRFRPEIPVVGVDSGAAPVAIASAVDPVRGTQWVVLAYRTTARQVAVLGSANGGTSFGSGSGGFGPTLVDAGPVTGSPAISLRVDDGVPLLAIGWVEGGAATVALSTAADFS